jgi:hypothetical protein
VGSNRTQKQRRPTYALHNYAKQKLNIEEVLATHVSLLRYCRCTVTSVQAYCTSSLASCQKSHKFCIKSSDQEDDCTSLNSMNSMRPVDPSRPTLLSRSSLLLSYALLVLFNVLSSMGYLGPNQSDMSGIYRTSLVPAG